jgi:hypothetical protein
VTGEVILSSVSDMRLMLVSGAESLLKLHAAELPQKNELCGAFWGTLALRNAGVTLEDGPLDQDAVGLAAGSFLSTVQDTDDLPPGEPGRTDYRVSFPTVDDSSVSGTSAGGLVRALGELSSDHLAVVPVAGPWNAAAVRAVLEAGAGCTQPCTVIANLATRHLWGSHPDPATLVAYLVAGDRDLGPPPDWDVGHFVSLLGAIEGPRGTLVLVADTYRALGWAGLHLQPVEGLAHALQRTGSGRPSGVIFVASADDRPALGKRIDDAGLKVDIWDNGSRDLVQTR